MTHRGPFQPLLFCDSVKLEDCWSSWCCALQEGHKGRSSWAHELPLRVRTARERRFTVSVKSQREKKVCFQCSAMSRAESSCGARWLRCKG